MKKQRKIDIRPNYYNTQMLVAEDFLAEQSYHVKARQRHNVELHGSGIVNGLKVLSKSDTSVNIEPGYAIDGKGREIFLESAEEIDISEFSPDDIVNVILTCQEGKSTEAAVANTSTKSIYVVIETTTEKNNSLEGVLLAKVKIGPNKKIKIDSINFSETQYAGAILAPNSVGPVELTTELRTGWVCTAFHPIGVVSNPDGGTVSLPSFKIGPTEAVSPEGKDDQDIGAAGVMNIVIPMSVKKLTRFRIAGSINKDRIDFRLMLGGWDPKKEEHVSRALIKETILGAPYSKIYPVADKDTIIDPAYSTLSLWLKCTKRAAISLIGVEFEY